MPGDERKQLPRRECIAPPVHRRLQILALDPAADERFATATISRAVIQIPWEGHPTQQLPADEQLLPGPRGEYIEVIDVDPASNCVYDPVDLNDPLLLARDGHPPSLGNPQFHQQMVYGVAMKTIANFERVLGRTILWSDRTQDAAGNFLPPDQRFVQRLRIYPHALREQNAYYSPAKKALLFGYFNATTNDPRDELPGGVVFTCLSHDIVAHETTHAIIDGMHRRLLDASNRDMLAFHEAFADIVAIFQHFTLPGLLLNQIKSSRGDLRLNNRLAQLAAQFAQATGQGDALRNAIGEIDSHGRQAPPDPAAIERTTEPHQRGAILVAAVFDAFLSMYEHRVSDLYRIATGGTGVLPAGDIHPDLAERLAEAAAKTAQRVLDVCIRTLDYLPPVDVNFGDFLRGLITADSEFHPEDPRRFRLAFIDAFRSRGIVPRDVRSLGEDSLRWNRMNCDCWEVIEPFMPPTEILRAMANAYDYSVTLADFAEQQLLAELSASTCSEMLATRMIAALRNIARPAKARSTRRSRHRVERLFAQLLQIWLTSQCRFYDDLSDRKFAAVKDCLGSQLGLDLEGIIADRDDPDFAPLEVHAVRPAIRRRADGRTKLELLVMLTQSKMITVHVDNAPLRFKIRGGCTLLIDPDAHCITYAISKRLPTADEVRKRNSPRLERQLGYVREQLRADRQLAIARFGLGVGGQRPQKIAEPFAVVHRHHADESGY